MPNHRRTLQGFYDSFTGAVSISNDACLNASRLRPSHADGHAHARTPDVADETPTSSALTGFDEERLLTWIRLLDAAAEKGDWREVAKIVLHIDPEKEPERAFRARQTHLARAGSITTDRSRISWPAASHSRMAMAR